ncbi:hypothetical protein LDENG_00195080 [Lucifuga dentata]|nr:hypothetical protein LDENG_00195080 [Lucifuga dentata]
MAVERENVWGVAAEICTKEVFPSVRAAAGSSSEEERAAWVAEVTELIMAVTLQTVCRPCSAPRVCWGLNTSRRSSTTQPGKPGSTLPRSRPTTLAWSLSLQWGHTSEGDSCYIPVIVKGVPYSALVDTGSTVTLVRPEVVLGCTQLEPTTVQLRTVKGELAPLKGKGVLTVTVGGKTVHHPVWIAAVQDPCILGLDFLRATGLSVGPTPMNTLIVLPVRLLTLTVSTAKLMDKVLAGVPHQQCLVYVDDILVHGRSFEAALGSLQLVLERIKMAA